MNLHKPIQDISMTNNLNDDQCQELRRKVALRDGHKCLLCGKQGQCIHHILYRSYGTKGSPVIWQERNMITLCTECHLGAHAHPSRQHLFSLLGERYGYEYTEDYWQQYLHGGDTMQDQRGDCFIGFVVLVFLLIIIGSLIIMSLPPTQ